MSALLKKARDIRRDARWTCAAGVVLLPVMGFGGLLISCAKGERLRASAIESMVRDVYGANPEKVSELIRNEIVLFKTAMFAVNAEIKDGGLIHRDLTLLRMICVNSPRARRLYAAYPDAEVPERLKEYAGLVNAEYCRLGGNEAIVLYGIAEYVMIRNARDCEVNFYIDSLIEDTAMRADVLCYRRVIEPLLRQAS